MSDFIDWSKFKANTHKKLKSYHSNDTKKVISVTVENPKDTACLPENMLIVMDKALPLAVPVQVQFEIIPKSCIGWSIDDPNSSIEAPGFHVYDCVITSVKARVKPGSQEFDASESKNLKHIIEDTEDEAQKKDRLKKKLENIKKKEEANRFTGLEIE